MLSAIRFWIIEKLGGYTSVDEALASITDSKERIKILTKAVKRHFNTVGAEDILHVNEHGQWISEGKPISEHTKKLLIAQATQFVESELWTILQADIKYQANKRMFILAETELQIAAGKFWLYTLDAFKTRLQSVKAGNGHFNTKKK